MPLILNIDTATEFASVCISNGNETLGIEKNTEQQNHASFLQPAIKKIIQAANISLQQLDAIAVSAGPGSYTGLRVGLASAKGLCYALGKPLICVNTLEVMARACILHNNADENLYCPMIDARRMEVFTAVYNNRLEAVLQPCAMILNENSFAELLNGHTIIFSGSGIAKAQKILQHPKAQFRNVQHDATHLSILALQHFIENKFADAAYAEPLYLKEFYTIQPAKNLMQ